MKRLIALAVSIFILALILTHVDRAALWSNIQATRMGPFMFAMFLFIPQNAILAWRWRAMASLFAPISWRRSISMILASQSLNVVLPSKLGDLTKALFLKKANALDLPRAINLVVFEKALDMGSLCLLAFIGAIAALVAAPPVENPAAFHAAVLTTAGLSAAVMATVGIFYFVPLNRLPFYARVRAALGKNPKFAKVERLIDSSHEVVSLLQARHARRGRIIAVSISLWCLHMLQIYYFFVSLNAPVPVLVFCSLMPLAIFAGLLPISLFGVGTRDAVIIYLFGKYYPAATLAGVGMYVSLRYLVPALAGLPFLHEYFSDPKALKQIKELKGAAFGDPDAADAPAAEADREITNTS